MGMFLLLLIIATAIFVGIASKKFYDKPYVLNFAIALLMLLLVVQTLAMQPISMMGYFAIAFCSIAFVTQLVLGMKNVRLQA
ncbi:hypothetical protein [Planococcus shixiaomingii]|uniref:hypothetical protein n=1 Tax=Planococcus shixiaomingii TaxID=3058393 RepID=UPI00260F3BC1|nr:hypothetical protein [Planococcus sp. N022]WKA53316.1 hypothetical protein QWY21_11650 [Planococcus sp. N022]